MKKSSKLLSFCLFGRNDNYTPDFLYRLSTTINFLAHSAKIVGRIEALEILIVDWASKDKLKDNVQLTSDGAKVSRFIYVPPEYAVQSNGNGIPGNICLNIALRRAKGKLVGLCGAEVLIPASSLHALFNIIENKSAISDYEDKLYVCGRYRLPIEWVKSQPSVDEWQDYLQLNSWRIKQEPGRGSFLTGNAGLFIIPKKMLHQTRGLLEALDPYWGWNDVEYTMRAISQYQCIDLNSSGVTVYDMEHFNVAGERSEIIKKQAERILAQNLSANDNNWGGADLPVVIENAISSDSINVVAPRSETSFLSNDLIGAPVVTKNKLSDFCIWMANNLVGLPDETELAFLIVIFELVKNKNLLYYKEYGINQGHSFYLVGFLFKQSTLIGIDRWTMGGGEYGPDHIAYNLTTPLMKHQGHLRLINKNLLTQSHEQLGLLENLAEKGMVLYRIEERESFIDMSKSLTYDLKHHDVILIGRQAYNYAQRLLDNNPSLNLHIIVNEESCLLSHGKIKHVVESDYSIKQLNKLITQGRDFTSLPIDQLYEKLIEISSEKMIIWTENQAILKLVFPHIKKNIVAIITENSECIYEGIPVITNEDLSAYPSELVVKLG